MYRETIFTFFSIKMHQSTKINAKYFLCFRQPMFFSSNILSAVTIAIWFTVNVYEKCRAARLHVVIALFKHLHNNDFISFGSTNPEQTKMFNPWRKRKISFVIQCTKTALAQIYKYMNFIFTDFTIGFRP